MIHIHAPPTRARPWQPTPVERVTDCCVRRVPAGQAQQRLVIDLSGWYDPHLQVRCPPGAGCNADRRLLRGAAGRRDWVYGW